MRFSSRVLLLIPICFMSFVSVGIANGYLNSQSTEQSENEIAEENEPSWATGLLTPTAYLPIIVKPVEPFYVFDDFSDPESGWETYDGILAGSYYHNGEYRIVSAQGAVFKGSAYHYLEDFEVSVTCRLEDEGIYFNGSGYCIITFGNNTTGVHEFAIDSNNNWYLYHIPSLPFLAPYDYEEYTLLASGSSNAIQSALVGNRLKAIRQNGNIALFVNDTGLYTGTLNYSGKAYIALKSLPLQQHSWGYDARFDNYELIEKLN